jgi:hypothetical protein
VGDVRDWTGEKLGVLGEGEVVVGGVYAGLLADLRKTGPRNWGHRLRRSEQFYLSVAYGPSYVTEVPLAIILL